jgi:serine/threonine protein phosphatase PrpC
MVDNLIYNSIIDSKRWTAFTLSVIGPGHIADEMPNQDAVYVYQDKYDPDKGLAIGLSDGLGTSPCSDIGAAMATKIACEQLTLHLQRINENVTEVMDLSDSAYGTVSAAANIVMQWRVTISKNSNVHRDYACTSLVAVVVDNLLCVGQLGDGLAGILMPDRSYQTISIPRTTYSNVTESIADSDAVDKWKWAVFDHTEEMPIMIFLASDGISDDLEPESINEFLGQLYEELCRDGATALRLRLMDWLDHWPTTAHSDDKSLAILFRNE